MNLLHQSDQAVSSGNWARANELLERAQTTALNAQAMGGGTPRPGDRVGLPSFEDAKQAMMHHNRTEAHQALQTAMAGTERAMSNTATGSSAGTMPMHSGGMGGSYATPAQAQPQGGLGTSGASPYGSAQGTGTMPNAVQPGTSALGNVQGQTAGPRGAPAPGQPFPGAGGSSSPLSTGGQIRPGSPTLGGGTGGSTGGGGGGASGAGR